MTDPISRMKNFFLTLVAVIAATLNLAAADFGLVAIPVACLRGEPSNSAELVSQAVMGTPLRLLDKDGEWWSVETPDGYHGYMTESSLAEADRDSWLKAPRMVITALPATVMVDERGSVLSPLPAGAIVEVSHGMIRLPDGRLGIVDPAAMMSLEEWGSQTFSPRKVVETARALMGTPYLWGGMSPWAVDCSGLVRVAYWLQGRILPRDASQQASVGDEVPLDALSAGDLLFLDRSGSGRVNHVAICDGHGRVIHAGSGRVRDNALDSGAKDVISGVRLSARRTSGTPALPLLTEPK